MENRASSTSISDLNQDNSSTNDHDNSSTNNDQDSSYNLSSKSTSDDHHKNNSTLDNLPDIIIHFHLFEYLDLDDVWQLRLLSKKFRSIVESYDIIELSFLGDNCALGLNYKDIWCSTTKSTKLRNHVALSKLNSLVNPSRNLFDLKYLRIHGPIPSTMKLKEFNKFVKLQILELGSWNMSSGGILCLPDLLAISIYGCLKKPTDTCKGRLIFDMPNLHTLYTNDSTINMIRFEHQQSIKFVSLKTFVPDAELQLPSNLECLELQDLIDFNVNNLIGLMNLRQIKLISDYEEELNKLKIMFFMKKDDLEVFLDGVKIERMTKIDERRKKTEVEFQLDNFDQLDDNLEYCASLQYVESVFLNYRPVDLCRKFTNIQRINVTLDVKDEARLIDFIAECPNVCSLQIWEARLSQQFYDQLPAIGLWACLKINEEKIRLNFDFIMKMSCLNFILTDQDLLRSENLNLNNLPKLRGFCFQIGTTKIQMVKQDKDKYFEATDMFEMASKAKCKTLDKLTKKCIELRNINKKKPTNKKKSKKAKKAKK